MPTNPPTTTQTHQLLTLGYESRTLGGIQALLDRFDALLVDIRLQPRSRLPQWNQATLRFQFQDRYTHVRHLGNPNYASGGPITLLAPERALDDIEQWLRTRSLILMCACQDANFCHRTAAAVWLKRRLFLEHVYHIDTYGISPGR